MQPRLSRQNNYGTVGTQTADSVTRTSKDAIWKASSTRNTKLEKRRLKLQNWWCQINEGLPTIGPELSRMQFSVSAAYNGRTKNSESVLWSGLLIMDVVHLLIKRVEGISYFFLLQGFEWKEFTTFSVVSVRLWNFTKNWMISNLLFLSSPKA